MRWPVIVVAGCLVLSLAACKKEQPAADKPAEPGAGGAVAVQQPAGSEATPKEAAKPAAPESPTEAGQAKAPEGGAPATPVAAPVTETKVEMIDAGAEPRQALRYKFAAGRKDVLLMDMDMAMAIKAGTMEQPEMQLPRMRMTMEVDSKELTPDGNLKYGFNLTTVELVEDPAANQMLVQALKGEITKMQGLNGTAEVTPRGFTKQADIKVPEGAGQQVQQMLDNMQQQIRQMSAPLPEEPVGVGARWKVVMPIELPLIKMQQTATYELTSIQGDTGEFKIVLEQNAPPQTMTIPNLPAGAKADLKALESKASGTIQFDLTKIVPRSDLTTNVRTVMAVDAGGQAQELTMSMRVGIKIAPKE